MDGWVDRRTSDTEVGAESTVKDEKQMKAGRGERCEREEEE